MLLNVFAKKRTTKDGKIFYNYLTTLTKKDGEQETVELKFRDDCGQPKADNCPRCIEVKKENVNLVKRNITVYPDTDADCEGRTIEERKLWVSAWEDKGAYLDHSLDEYDFD